MRNIFLFIRRYFVFLCFLVLQVLALYMLFNYNRFHRAAFLGIDVTEWGGAIFQWADENGTTTGGMTVWSLTSMQSDQFAPATTPFMINYRVADLHALLEALRAEGCDVLEKVEDSEYGKFGWVMDPEGNKVELWQPPEGQ